MWYRDRKIARDDSGRKIKPTGFIYLTGSNFREDKGDLTMRSCLQDAFNNSAPRIGKYINNLELYRKFPPTRVKDTKMSEIYYTSGVRSVMKVTPLSLIEIEPWGAASILRIVNDGVYICTCLFISD